MSSPGTLYIYTHLLTAKIVYMKLPGVAHCTAAKFLSKCPVGRFGCNSIALMHCSFVAFECGTCWSLKLIRKSKKLPTKTKTANIYEAFSTCKQTQRSHCYSIFGNISTFKPFTALTHSEQDLSSLRSVGFSPFWAWFHGASVELKTSFSKRSNAGAFASVFSNVGKWLGMKM